MSCSYVILPRNVRDALGFDPMQCPVNTFRRSFGYHRRDKPHDDRGSHLPSLPALLAVSACGGAPPSGTPSTAPPARPSILLVTLDTTRADAIGPEARGVETPAFNALAARGRRFRQAYATAPETLPSHSSMMTGLYPGGHGVHENARHLADAHPVAGRAA